MSKGDAAPVRRIEVFTGAGRRRAWSAEEKARVVAESHSGDDTVCGVARRHGLTPQQLFAWRRQARRALPVGRQMGGALFVPAVVAAMPPAASAEPLRPRRARTRSHAPGLIEVEIDGVVIRVGQGAEAKTVAAVIRALKSTA